MVKSPFKARGINAAKSSTEAPGSNCATARENTDFNLLEQLDQLQWHLDDVDMKTEDRFEIDHFLGTLLQGVVVATAKKKKRLIHRFFQKFFCWKRSKRKTRRRNRRKKNGSPNPILPPVVFIPSSSSFDDSELGATLVQMETPPSNDVLYYLHDDAYLSKAPSFFQTLKEDRKVERKHKRVPTEATVRMDSSRDPDLYEKINDDCFFDLDTGVIGDDLAV